MQSNADRLTYTDEEIMDNKIDITLIIYSTAIFSGISYLWGFWIYFDINILSYIALTDIVKASVYPALPAIGVLVLYSSLDGMNATSKENNKEIIEMGGFYKWFTHFYNLYFMVLFFCIIGYWVYLIVSEDGYNKLQGIYPLASALLIVFFLTSKKKFFNFPDKIRVGIITLICFLPTYLFNKGSDNGAIASNHEAIGYFVNAKGYCNSTKSEKFRYISVIGNKLFTYSSKDNSMCITKAEDFRLTKYNEKKFVKKNDEAKVRESISKDK